MSAIQNTAAGTAAASFIAGQIGLSIAGTFGMGYANLVFGQAAWVASVGALGEKVANGTATSGDYANVIQKTGTLLLGLGLTVAQINPWVRGAFALASGVLFFYNNWDKISDLFDRAKEWTIPRDPIILDLDGTGLETVGLASNVYFDHDGDGVLTKTGWAGKNDALLVWDRNGNGSIDTGAELFGDFTPLPNGTLAPNGFAALVALDANHDGIIDASDPAFAELKLWRDASQDGVSQGGELFTLADAGIVSLNLDHLVKNQALASGNVLSREGSFTRADGSTGGMGEFRLAIDTFHSKFAEPIDVPDALKTLPNMGGSGKVRELQQAAAQSSELAALLAKFQAAPTRAEQKALMGQLLEVWADTSGMAKSLNERAGGSFKVAEPANSELQRMLHVLEAFNGQYFFSLPNEKQSTPNARAGLNITYGSWHYYHDQDGIYRLGWFAVIPPYVSIGLSEQQNKLLASALDALEESVYASLVMQTRLKPYLDQVELVIDDNGLRLDATQLNQTLEAKKASDPENHLADLLDLDRYAPGLLTGTNWSGLADFDSLLDTLPQTTGIAALLNEFEVLRLTAGDDKGWFTDRTDIVLAGDGNDTLDGGSGNDRLFGQGGDDLIYGSSGDDLISGGAGNDELEGEYGADTYIFGRGYGNDTIRDHAENGVQRDVVRLFGLNPADVKVTADDKNNIVFTIVDTGETLSVPYGGTWWGKNGVGSYLFDDGTVWSTDDALRATVAKSTENDDVIHGSNADDTIIGKAGDDTLIGKGGNDVINGGTGDDLLIGDTGHDILEGGAGDDTLHGGGEIWRGDHGYDGYDKGEGDTYIFGRGDGHDTIFEDSWRQGETDRIEFKAGVTPADVRLERVRTVEGWLVSDDLQITIRDTGETLTVKNHFNESNRFAVEEIAFADGTLWSADDIKAHSLLGGSEDDELRGFQNRGDQIEGNAGHDKLIGLSGNDTLVGGAGDDVLEGGADSDTYRFGLGDGQDLIIDGRTVGTDVVELNALVSPADVLVRWTLQGDMAVTLPDGSKLTVRGQADSSSTEQGIEQLRFADGTVWDRKQLATRALAATGGDDAIMGGDQDDTLDGGAGNDRFQDLGGDDTYCFGVGDDQDTIADKQGRLLFKAGIGQNDVTFTREGDDLIVTITSSGDAVRIQGWMNSFQRIDGFDFDNGAHLGVSEVLAQLNISEGEETLYGLPGDDVLIGTEKISWIYGSGGNDSLSGGAGSDQLFGEAGDDTLDGGTDRDWLFGGQGNNTYRVAAGMGLDHAVSESLMAANDTVVFAPGIKPKDVSVQLGGSNWISQPGDVGYYSLVIGIGGNDALILRTDNWDDLGRSAFQRFRFEDGTEWTLSELIAHADNGTYGFQSRYLNDATDIIGSQADDEIRDYTGQSVTVQARGNNDIVHLEAGNDLVSAGSGDDSIYAGAGEDWVAGEAGTDNINTSDGDDVVLFNRGDGNDTLRTEDGTDTLSFGVTISPAMLSAALDRNGRVVLLVDAGAGGSIALDNTDIYSLPGDLERIQFINADGRTRVFDIAGWLQAHAGALLSASPEAPLAFDGTGFELTGTVVPAGGLHAVAYAQAGDLFASAKLSNNTPTDGDDVLYGTPDGDTLNAGAGNDLALGLAGNDTIFGDDGNDLIHGGEGDDILAGDAGNDVIHGGGGADQLTGGSGNDQLFGEAGGDTYVYQAGHGEVTIADDHQVLDWGFDHSWDGGEGDGGTIVDDAPNTLTFGPGIRPDDLRYSERNGDLVIEFLNRPDDRVILRGYEPNRATQTRSVDVIRFADGTEIVAEAIDFAGKTVVATDDGSALYGTPYADILLGGDGDDWLNGDGGADSLVGGAGSDTYVVYKAWGSQLNETLIAETWRAQDFNRIEIQGDVKAEDLRLAFDGSDLLLRLGEEGDVIRFAGFDPRAEGMQAPVSDIYLPWWGINLSFDALLTRGVSIIGTPDNDVLTGTALADWIEGREADDTMNGGAGGDLYLINADGGSDTIIDSETGDATNTLVLPEGTTLDDVRLSYDATGFLILDLVNTGNRIRMSGFDPENPLEARAIARFRFGIDGAEITYEELLARGFDILGTGESDALKGTMLSDRVRGGEGHDLIQATPGNDFLAGEGGNDSYVVMLGDGIVTIDDLANEHVGNVLRFGPGIDPELLRNNLRFEADDNGGHVLLLPYGDNGDTVRLMGFNPLDVLGNHAVDRFEFFDGTAVDYATLVSWTFVVEGDSSDNALTGTNVNDRLYGHDGGDIMESGQGEDVLTGGMGNDILRGGAQRDAYVVHLGDGADVIVDDLDAGVGNVLTFGEGIAPSNISTAVDGVDLLIHYGAYGDVVRVNNYAPRGADGGTVIDTLEFADGTAFTLRELMNHAPEVSTPVDDQMALEDAAFRVVLPDDLFTDADGDDVVIKVTVSDQQTVPAWLQYDAATRTLFGTPNNEDVGEISVIVEGTDTLGASTSYRFGVTVNNTNDAPIVGAPLSDLRALEDSAFSFTLPAGTFRDIDVGDVLTYSATLVNGDPLPDWLSFDAQTSTFSGTPGNADTGALQLTITATDLAGSSCSQVFTLSVINTNDGPNIGAALAAQTATEDSEFTFTIPTDAFADPDVNDRLSYSATLADGSALPSWLQLDPATGTFRGTPGNNHVGTLEIMVQATDMVGALARQSFKLTVINSDDAPEISFPLADQQATEDAPFAFTVPKDAFRDADVGDVLTLSASQADGSFLPTWLKFDAATRTFSGTPANGDVGSLSVRVTATDVANAQVSQTFSIGVTNVNDAPEVGTTLVNQTGHSGMALNWQVPDTAFFDVDAGDLLTYSTTLADGSALPAWLNFDAATGTFSGTPSVAGNFDLRVTATDRTGAQAHQSFTLSVDSSSRNQAPITTADVATLIEDEKRFTWGNVLANDRDPEGERLSVIEPGTRHGEYGLLTMLANGTYAYVLDNSSSKVQSLGAGESVTEIFNYTASDGTHRSSSALTVVVQGINDTPDLVRHLTDVQLAKGKAFSWRLPVGSFKDADRNDTLTYAATLTNGDALPSWLKFDATTQTFSGTAQGNAKGIIDVRVTAGDGHGQTSIASDVFKISFGSKTVAPPTGGEGFGHSTSALPPKCYPNISTEPDTSSGRPERRQDVNLHDDTLDRFLNSFKRGEQSDLSNPSAFAALDRRWFERWSEQQQMSGQAEQAQGDNDVERHWAALNQALNRLDAERQSAPTWSHVDQGADLSGLAGGPQGGSPAARMGSNAVSLAGETGTQLKGFSGIKEGVGRLSW